MGPEAVKVLLPEMRRRRIMVMDVVRRMGDAAVPELLNTLKDPAVGGYAREVLFDLAGQAAPSRTRDFIACMNEPETRDVCGGALLRVAPKASGQLSQIMATLKAKDPVVRVYGVQALMLLGKKAAKAVPALQKLKNDDPEANVRKAAEDALKKIQG
jgi:HEAT repeat protein